MFKIGEVFRSMWRNAAMTIASLILIFLTMLVLGASVILSANTSNSATEVVSKLKLHVYLETDDTEDDIRRIKEELESNPKTESIEFSSRDAQLNKVLENFSQDQSASIKSYFNGDKNPLNDVFYVTPVEGTDFETFKSEIKPLKGVQDVEYGAKDGADKLISVMRAIKWVSIGIVIFLLAVTIFLIINTIKLTINSRRKEIEIMRLVGATKSYITFPFTFEGFILGLTGSLLAFIALVAIYAQIYKGLNPFVNNALVPVGNVVALLVVFQLILGIIIGVVSSLIAIRRYLRV